MTPDRAEAVARWAFTAFCVLVAAFWTILWLV